MAKKPSLENLPIAARLQQKPLTAPAVAGNDAPAQLRVPRPAARRPNPPERDYKTVMARINFAGWRELRSLSLDTNEPLEQMIIRGLNNILAEAGRPSLIEHRRPEGKE